VFVELEQNGETCLRDKEMGRFEGNVVAGHPAFGNAIRYQILLDREVRKLYHWRTVHIPHSR
jgi:hypothetical protein